nr:hypothetical protein [Iningainema tapete]
MIASVSLLTLFAPLQANAQKLPQPWVSVGSKEGEMTYSVGAKASTLGVEYGVGPDKAQGIDVLEFIKLPIFSSGSITGGLIRKIISFPDITPYVGLGLYSQNKGLALSGGVHVSTSKKVFAGVGYNTVRGLNGQLGVKF